MPELAKEVQKNGRSGWYYRVLEEGTIEAGNPVELVEPQPRLHRRLGQQRDVRQTEEHRR